MVRDRYDCHAMYVCVEHHHHHHHNHHIQGDDEDGDKGGEEQEEEDMFASGEAFLLLDDHIKEGGDIDLKARGSNNNNHNKQVGGVLVGVEYVLVADEYV
jgi:hypothetical protein